MLSFKGTLKKIKELQGTPRSLARGTAIGVLIGIAPVMPLKSLLIFAITLVGRSSTVAALLVCTILCNPLTYVPLYYIDWLVGNYLLPGHANWQTLQQTLAQMQTVGFSQAVVVASHLGLETLMVLLAGGLLLAIPCAILSYPLAYRFFCQLEKKRAQKHILE